MAPGTSPFDPGPTFFARCRARIHSPVYRSGRTPIRGSAPEQSAAYNGFDLTADSLHVGHLIPIHDAALASADRHKPIVLMGGGTSRIGDPSFRDTTRPLLDDAQIEKNLSGIQRVFERFLQIVRWSRMPSRFEQRRMAGPHRLTSIFYVTLGGISLSTACSPSTPSFSGSRASSRCRCWSQLHGHPGLRLPRPRTHP